MIAKLNELSVFDGNIVLLYNCNVKLICFCFMLTNTNVV